MALAQGTSRMRTGCLTLHARTAIEGAEQLFPDVKFHVQKVDPEDTAATSSSDEYGKDGRIPGQHIVTCTGLGLKPGSIYTST